MFWVIWHLVEEVDTLLGAVLLDYLRFVNAAVV